MAKRESIFITGGNAGLGLAAARRFAREGVDVAVMARNAHRNEVARRQIEELGARCVTFAGDVANDADVAKSVAAAADAFGGLTYAFNCAGLSQSLTPLRDVACEEFDALMAVNARGTFLSMKHQLAVMREAGAGAICNCASAAGLIPSQNQVAYAASKFAVVAMTRGAALEEAKNGIRINVVCPGATTGGMWYDFQEKHPDFAELALSRHPMGRIGDADEVAEAVFFLCRNATFTTGHALTVDGGRTAG